MGFKTPKQTVEAVDGIGCTKASLPWSKLLVLGFLAGAFIAFGGFLAIIIGKGIPPTVVDGVKFEGISKFMFAGVFPVGLMLVVIAGSELFTGNTACLVPAVLNKKASWLGLLKNWSLVYIGNFAGSLFVAYCLGTLTGLVAKEPYLSAVQGIATGKAALPFFVAFWRGVGCNWLVCLAVWLAIASDDVASKVWGIWFPIMAFVGLGFEHSVANMFFIPLGMFQGANVSIGGLLIGNLLPVTLGNIVGGGFFVGVIYWWLYGRAEKQA
jgi:formate/nitrite transporter